MTFTYTPASLAKRGRDRVRFELHDTDESEVLLQDEEIDVILAENDTFAGAVAACAESVAAGFRRQVDMKVGPASFSYNARANAWDAIAHMWRQRADTAVAGPSGGPSIAGPGGTYFRSGMHDYHDTGPASSSGRTSGPDAGA